MALQVYVIAKPRPFVLFFPPDVPPATKELRDGTHVLVVELSKELRVEVSEGRMIIYFENRDEEMGNITHVTEQDEIDKLIALFALDVQFINREDDDEQS